MVSAPTKPLKSPYITHLASFLSQNSPMNSVDEAFFNSWPIRRPTALCLANLVPDRYHVIQSTEKPYNLKFPTKNAQIPVGGAINRHSAPMQCGVFNVLCRPRGRKSRAAYIDTVRQSAGWPHRIPSISRPLARGGGALECH